MTMRMVQVAACAAMFWLTATPVRADVIIPTGVHNDVSFDTVVNDWGWTLLYEGSYGDMDVNLASILSGAGEYLMLAAMRHGATEIEVLAAAPTTDVLTYTAHNTTHTANGAEWYYNAYSMGFAGLGDTIFQNTADTAGLNERDRLSWHTGVGTPGFGQNVNLPPVDLDGGYRAGDAWGLSYSLDWDRLIFTANITPPDPPGDPTVCPLPIENPEPTSLALWSMGLLGLAASRARRGKRDRSDVH